MKNIKISDRKKFFLNIIIPTLLTVILFILLIFAIIIPHYQSSLIDSKKEMIKELINSSICIADNYRQKAERGEISETEAKAFAISSLQSIRYGIENKDYIWITDDAANMIMHPYRKDLIGKNVANFTDPNGKKMFLEMVRKANSLGEGFVDYKWQWMDDSSRIVSKISFIKEYQDWNWIIGTGVYIEDVNESIAEIISSLIWTSIGIFAIVSFLLIVIVRTNLKIDNQRSEAEENLKESNEKYKALVEASSDGTLMFINDECIFGNKKIEEMISHEKISSLTPDLSALIDNSLIDDIHIIRAFLSGYDITLRLETRIISSLNEKINVLISFSKVSFSEQAGIIITIKDLSLNKDEEVLNILLSDVFSNVAEKLAIGVFRALPTSNGRLAEANSQFIKLLAYDSIEEIDSISIFDLFEDSMQLKEFISTLYSNGFIKEYNCRVSQKDGNIIELLLSAALIRRKDGSVEYIDGLITDFSRQKRGKQRRDNLLARLINHLSVWDIPVRSLNLKKSPNCSPTITFDNALEIMDFHSSNIVTYSDEAGKNFMLTKDKILDMMSLPTFRFQNKINSVACPVNLLSENATAEDCLFDMIKNNRNYAAINSISDGVMTFELKEIISLFGSNTKFLSDRLKQSQSLSELLDIHNDLPTYIGNFVKAGTDIEIITNTITSVSDAITQKIIENAISQCGTPPAKFAFIALGSEGRSEQGLSTDQDNAIIIEQFDKDKFQDVSLYFAKLADIINNLLKETGYSLCTGGIMANNPKWNTPVNQWKHYFHNWIIVPEPQSLLESSIFFDFRCLHGEEKLTDELRYFINTAISDNPRFLNLMATLTFNYKLPVGMFGKIHTETKDDFANKFNLKNALRLIVNIVRLYSMKHGINETNTLARLRELYDRNHIQLSFYSEVEYTFKYLMSLQFRNQTNQHKKGIQPDNYLDLSLLNSIELSSLKTVLSSISGFQSKIKYDFSIS